MSKATNQTILLLSMISGALNMIIDSDVGKREDVASVLHYTYELSGNIVAAIPETGKKRNNIRWMSTNLKTWSTLVNEESLDWPPLVLITMTQNIVEDLLSIIKDRDKVEPITELAECVRAAAKKIDADNLEEEYTMMDRATKLLHQMYDIIEFPYRG